MKKGLIFGCILDGQGGATPLSVESLEAVGLPDKGSVWLHFDRTVPATQDWMQTKSQLPEHILNALLAEDTRPRCEKFPAGILVILRGVNLNPGQNPEDMISLRIWASPDLVITLRHMRTIAVSNIEKSFALGNGPTDTGELVAMLADKLVDRIGPFLSEVKETLDLSEETARENISTVSKEELTVTLKKVITLHRFVAPQRAALSRLSAFNLDWISEESHNWLRQTLDDVTRYVEDLDAMKEQANMILDLLTASLAESMNRTMYLLSLVAGIFLPLGLLTGLLGINVAGVPGTENPWAFWIVCLVLVIAGIGEWLIIRFLRLY